MGLSCPLASTVVVNVPSVTMSVTGPLVPCGLRVDDQRCDNGNERDGTNDTDGDTASDELFAPTLGTLCLELGIGLFIGNLGGIVRASALLFGMYVCNQRNRFGGTFGRVLGIIRAWGDGGDIRHSVSFIERFLNKYMRPSR